MPRAPKTPPLKNQGPRDRSDPRHVHGRVRSIAPRASSGEVRLDIEQGSRVRVLDGAFAGKVGVVQELDAKGGARVMLGLLSVRFELRQLAVHSEGRARPVLATSHRKPLPARS